MHLFFMVYLLLCGLWHYSVELVNTSELSATLVFSIVDLFLTQNHEAFTGYKRSPGKPGANYNV